MTKLVPGSVWRILSGERTPDPESGRNNFFDQIKKQIAEVIEKIDFLLDLTSGDFFVYQKETLKALGFRDDFIEYLKKIMKNLEEMTVFANQAVNDSKSDPSKIEKILSGSLFCNHWFVCYNLFSILYKLNDLLSAPVRVQDGNTEYDEGISYCLSNLFAQQNTCENGLPDLPWKVSSVCPPVRSCFDNVGLEVVVESGRALADRLSKDGDISEEEKLLIIKILKDRQFIEEIFATQMTLSDLGKSDDSKIKKHRQALFDFFEKKPRYLRDFVGARNPLADTGIDGKISPDFLVFNPVSLLVTHSISKYPDNDNKQQSKQDKLKKEFGPFAKAWGDLPFDFEDLVFAGQVEVLSKEKKSERVELLVNILLGLDNLLKNNELRVGDVFVGLQNFDDILLKDAISLLLREHNKDEMWLSRLIGRLSSFVEKNFNQFLDDSFSGADKSVAVFKKKNEKILGLYFSTGNILYGIMQSFKSAGVGYDKNHLCESRNIIDLAHGMTGLLSLFYGSSGALCPDYIEKPTDFSDLLIMFPDGREVSLVNSGEDIVKLDFSGSHLVKVSAAGKFDLDLGGTYVASARLDLTEGSRVVASRSDSAERTYLEKVRIVGVDGVDVDLVNTYLNRVVIDVKGNLSLVGVVFSRATAKVEGGRGNFTVCSAEQTQKNKEDWPDNFLFTENVLEEIAQARSLIDLPEFQWFVEILFFRARLITVEDFFAKFKTLIGRVGSGENFNPNKVYVRFVLPTIQALRYLDYGDYIDNLLDIPEVRLCDSHRISILVKNEVEALNQGFSTERFAQMIDRFFGKSDKNFKDRLKDINVSEDELLSFLFLYFKSVAGLSVTLESSSFRRAS